MKAIRDSVKEDKRIAKCIAEDASEPNEPGRSSTDPQPHPAELSPVAEDTTTKVGTSASGKQLPPAPMRRAPTQRKTKE